MDAPFAAVAWEEANKSAECDGAEYEDIEQADADEDRAQEKLRAEDDNKVNMVLRMRGLDREKNRS